jgi:endonuclease/exonuclease/phosphatase family metal-dependent hydrolase
MRKIAAALAIALCFAAPELRAESVRLATYNIENFHGNFEAYRLTQSTRNPTPQQQEEIRNRRDEDDEDNWEIAETILDKNFQPDILVIQECCGQKDLEYFNDRWLQKAYSSVIVFPTNTDRDQHLGMLLKPGFTVVQRRDQYHKEPDTAPNERGTKLFARGPAFCLIQTPSGYRFWLGVTHQKSKSGDSLEATRWRNRESKRTHQIIKELERSGPGDVMLMGDLNDDVTLSDFEKEAGQDAVATVLGDEQAGLELVTRKLIDAKAISYHGYWRTRYRSLIDHAVVTRDMKHQVQDVQIFTGSLAKVASDHYPLYVDIKSDPPPAR